MAQTYLDLQCLAFIALHYTIPDKRLGIIKKFIDMLLQEISDIERWKLLDIGIYV